MIDTTDPVYQLWLAFRGSVSRAECQAKVDQYAALEAENVRPHTQVGGPPSEVRQHFRELLGKVLVEPPRVGYPSLLDSLTLESAVQLLLGRFEELKYERDTLESAVQLQLVYTEELKYERDAVERAHSYTQAECTRLVLRVRELESVINPPVVGRPPVARVHEKVDQFALDGQTFPPEPSTLGSLPES